MSITTKTGDDGKSGLIGGARRPKTDSHFAAIGAIDELNAAIGLARATADDDATKLKLEEFQRTMIWLGAEAATEPKDFSKFSDKFISEGLIEKLHQQTLALQGERKFSGFEIPGNSPINAALHFARVVCRRAERELWILHEKGQLTRITACLYLNRLSDLLWMMAETPHE